MAAGNPTVTCQNDEYQCEIVKGNTVLRKYCAYLPALLMDFCFSAIFTNTAFYSSYLHLSSTFLGTLTAISTGIYVILVIPLGRLSDRIERTYNLAAGCLLLAVLSFILPFCFRKLHLAVVFPCVGISQAFFWPAYEAWLAERGSDGHMIKRLMLFNLFWSIGITAGPVTSSYLYQGSNPVIPFYLAGGFSLLNWSIVFFHAKLHKDIKNAATPTPNLESTWVATQSPPASQHVYLQIARIANFGSWFSLGVLRRIAPKLTLEMGISARMFGNLMLTLGGVQTLTFLWFGTKYSTRWHYRLLPLVCVQFLAVMGFAGMWCLTHAVLWALAFATMAVCAGVTYFSSLYYSLHGEKNKGDKSGWHEAILGTGILFGPFLGGVFADSALGIKSPYLLCAGVIAICIFLEGLSWVWAGEHRSK